MDNYNFTKGKWSFKNNSIIYSGNVPIASSFTLISTVDETRLQNESWLDMRKRTEPERIACYIEQKANTLLISKAPEMLEALKMFVEAVYTEEIIIKENYDNDGHENCGGRLYQKFKQLIKEATEL